MKSTYGIALEPTSSGTAPTTLQNHRKRCKPCRIGVEVNQVYQVYAKADSYEYANTKSKYKNRAL